MKHIFISASLLFFLLCGCRSNEVMESKNVAQSEIHQQYDITYDDQQESLDINAEFRVAGPNGTTLVLSEPSDVVCNGNEMKLDTYLFGGAHYVYTQKQNISGDMVVNIDFMDTERQPYKNSFVINAIGMTDVWNPGFHLKKDSANYISLKTGKLESEESMWVEIQGDSSSVNIAATGNRIRISPEQLKPFQTSEKVWVQVIRQKSGKVTHGTPRGGGYSVTSRSKKLETTLR